MSVRSLCAVLVAALLLAGCGGVKGKYEKAAPAEKEARFSEFLGGRAKLDCESIKCNVAFNQQFQELEFLYEFGDWQELARRILDIGAFKIMSLLYLGRAAEELGRPTAAWIYYSQASYRPKGYKCKNSLKACHEAEWARKLAISRMNALELFPRSAATLLQQRRILYASNNPDVKFIPLEKGCDQFELVDTTLPRSPDTHQPTTSFSSSSHWYEVWTFSICGARFPLGVNFCPDKSGEHSMSVKTEPFDEPGKWVCN